MFRSNSQLTRSSLIANSITMALAIACSNSVSAAISAESDDHWPFARHPISTAARALSVQDADVTMIINDMPVLYRELPDAYYRQVHKYLQEGLHGCEGQAPKSYKRKLISTALVNLQDLRRAVKDLGHPNLIVSVERNEVCVYYVTTETIPPDLAAQSNILEGLAVVSYKQRNYAQAAKLLEQALEMKKQSMPKDSLEIPESMELISQAYRASGDYDKAEQILRDSLKLRVSLQGTTHRDVAAIYEKLSMLSYDRNRAEEAKELHNRAVKLLEGNVEVSARPIPRSIGCAKYDEWRSILGAADDVSIVADKTDKRVQAESDNLTLLLRSSIEIQTKAAEHPKDQSQPKCWVGKTVLSWPNTQAFIRFESDKKLEIYSGTGSCAGSYTMTAWKGQTHPDATELALKIAYKAADGKEATAEYHVVIRDSKILAMISDDEYPLLSNLYGNAAFLEDYQSEQGT